MRHADTFPPRYHSRHSPKRTVIQKQYQGYMYHLHPRCALYRRPLSQNALLCPFALDCRLAIRKTLHSPQQWMLGYTKIMKQIPEKFMNSNLCDITALDVQEEINRMSKEHSPKTVRNYHGFISAVLGVFYPNLKLTTTLPQKIKHNPYIPSDKDVKRILEYTKDTEYEIPLILACYGLRRSEIYALTLDDIDGDCVHVTKAKVQNEKKEGIVKTTKITASTREIIIPIDIADKIRKKGYIYKGHPNSITRYLEKAEDALEIPCFPLYKLRHYFASKMSAMNIPEADIIKMGGWETDHVMKSVYRYSACSLLLLTIFV